MAHSIEVREKAVGLRSKGYSFNEISDRLNISKGLLSQWLSGLVLSPEAKQRLRGKISAGQLAAIESHRKKTRKLQEEYDYRSALIIDAFHPDKNVALVLAAMIYWCEGAKNPSRGIDFTNSDARLVKTFLNLLRTAFVLDEKKFKAVVHVHSYHDPARQIKFWSKVTNIPVSQFSKPFLKRNSGRRIREGYEGCISVRYFDAKIGRQLLSLAQAFMVRY